MRRLAVVLVVLAACGGAPKQPTTGKPSGVQPGPPGRVQDGLATWYGGSLHGGPTASGERFNKFAMTAAHRKLKFNTRVRVTNKRNGKSVVVRINDRGPYGKAIIDLSEAAARELHMIEAGVVPVHLEVLE